VDKVPLFEKNLRLLSLGDPALSAEIARFRGGGKGRYRFVQARSGETVPAIMDGERSRPLHSTVDPKREAARLVSSFGANESFLVFFGLGGGFHVAAALDRPETGQIIIVEYGMAGLAELFSALDYGPILGDSRVSLLLDMAPAALEDRILESYLPTLSGDFRLHPLRARTELSPDEFALAGEAVRRALERVSADYSVQAHFGSRWFGNILRNLRQAEEPGPLPRLRRAAVCAACPSLDVQIPLLAEDLQKPPPERPFLIATDTSLPALLHAGIEPDAAVSIDCQHISYYHFMGCGTGRETGETSARLPGGITLFLDLASPPPLARLSSPCFFSGGHPLGAYISRYWRPLLRVDSSGGNVTYAAVSLAEKLGAGQIDLYGADFSYPLGRSYARGTYIYPFFEKQQNRRNPLEALHSAFLYRSPLEKIRRGAEASASWYYETATLRRYRESLEEKTASMTSRIRPIPGLGAPIRIKPGAGTGSGEHPPFKPGPARMGADEFISAYRDRLLALGPVGGRPGFGSIRGEDSEKRLILTTLLPLAAALRRRKPELRADETLERAREYALAAIERVLGS
jgi:hypothetical protein